MLDKADLCQSPWLKVVSEKTHTVWEQNITCMKYPEWQNEVA